MKIKYINIIEGRTNDKIFVHLDLYPGDQVLIIETKPGESINYIEEHLKCFIK